MITRGSAFSRTARYSAGFVVALILAAVTMAPLLTVGAGQSVLGGVQGVVRDASKAALPGVTVRLKNEETGLAQSMLTNDTGAFSFIVAPGKRYTLTAEFSGFKKAELTKLEIRASETSVVSITLEVGTINSAVVVGATQNKSLSTPSSGVTLEETRIKGLPLTGNDKLTQITTLPGYRANPLGHEYDTVGGLPMSMMNASRDGLSATDNFSWAGRSMPAGVPLSAATIVPTDVRALLDGTPNRVLPTQPGAEAYDPIVDNPFVRVSESPLATFSSDVDTASYSNVRRFLTRSQAPPRDAVRIEEMINYFTYDYPKASGPHPIAANIEVASAPWDARHRLVRIGIKAKEVQLGQKPSNLVFLIDVSGSMAPAERLPLLKSALRMLTDRLTESDRVTIVTYAGTTGIALRPTSGDRKDVILQAIDALQAGGSTNGGAGIQLAYENAIYNFVENGVNRVILATDGDFNVGITNRNDLLNLIQEKAKSGVFLTALGFGMGNFKDGTLEGLADKGNGNYAYIDSLNEARKALVEQLTGTLVTVAKDVKIQVEFNPALVWAYRLIGYENRALRAQDFADDRKDAGDMGAGHTVTALFEVVMQNGGGDAFAADGLRYQPAASSVPAKSNKPQSGELLNLRVRYKEPDGSESQLIEFPTKDSDVEFSKASADFRFAASVASFGMILRNSPYRGSSSMENVLRTATASKGPDRQGYREEFLQLVQQAVRIGLR
jgi:Ca-activated chloride channel family protein